ncbi:hypothetical protein AR457_35175 [Streptomyces agglomeratus]|nr:hypothetical protein BGK70_02665 [Streptomyces agglomeratus]OEJ48571.1 hypothetical protein AR457_35175 [Streptomyces agglomeratus]OEJ57076.1 hypothetical protein BGM19_02770 [Streptomyces agglomeratus]
MVTAAAVTGLGGAGKTALALQAAREAQSLGWFPGGVLFVDLHGHDDAPVAPEKALEALLRALGTAPEYIPPTADERAGLYQSMLAEIAAERGPVLIVADNAAQASQARPLLPALSVHRMLVTSRETLAQLDAHQLHLGVLAPAIAWEVLEKHWRSPTRVILVLRQSRTRGKTCADSAATYRSHCRSRRPC